MKKTLYSYLNSKEKDVSKALYSGKGEDGFYHLAELYKSADAARKAMIRYTKMVGLKPGKLVKIELETEF